LLAAHDANFWRSIPAHDFEVPVNQSIADLALEIADLAADTNPELRDQCGYEILASWVYRKNVLSSEQLETLRRKILPGMTAHLGESDNPTIFRRSFSALYMSILAAHDLQHPFFSDTAFRETLDAALQCYAREKDFRGYSPKQGWAHGTAHVADLVKFLGRNPRLSTLDQKRIVETIAQRCRTAPSVFVWGEDARIAAALLSLVNRKDFDPSAFEAWFKSAATENKQLWSASILDTTAYVRVRNQANVLVQLAAKIGANPSTQLPDTFRTALNSVITELN